MKDCIFCKIINKEIPGFIVQETTSHLAFLDINPNTKGVTLVIPKTHVESNLITTDQTTYIETLKFSKEVATKLSKKLNVERVGLAIEGTGVDHLHIKLYPFHKDQNINTKLEESHEKIFNDFYPGYLTTKLGPQADFKELEKLAENLNI